MCKKCKDCGKSNLGAIITHVETIAVRILDGVVSEQFPDSVTDTQTTEINYCFECAKAITEEDLVEDVQCPVCGKMVGGLTESGACQDCTDEANRLSSMTKEQLILMLMKQAHTGAPVEVTTQAPVCGSAVAVKDGADAETAPSNEVEKEEEISDTSLLEDSLNISKDEEDETGANTPKKTRVRKKPEAAAVTAEGISEAKEEIIEKLEDVEIVDAVDPNTILDAENTAALTTIDDANVIPVANPNDDVDDILKKLDEVNLQDGDEIF